MSTTPQVPASSTPSRVACLLTLVFVLLLSALSANNAQAQQGVRPPRVYPADSYYFIFRDFYDGELRDALREFQRAGRGGLKLPGQSWIDSICYHTMVGECYYQLGQLDEALAQYESALRLVVQFPDWIIRVQFQPIQPAQPGQIRNTPWGVSQRQPRYGRYADKYLMNLGDFNLAEKVARGGVVQPPVLFQVGVPEIVRCSVLAMRRWRELLGPSCPHHQLTKDLFNQLSRRPTQPNHWSEAWVDVQLAMAQLAAGRIEQAKTVLERAVIAGGQYDHLLTSTVLLEMGHLALAEGQFQAAAALYEEATYAAAQYPDPDVLAEALRYGLKTHLASNQQGIYPPLQPALDWVRVNDHRRLSAELSILLAENQAVAGNGRLAQTHANDARTKMARYRELIDSRLGAALHYATAQALFQEGSGDGYQALAAAMQFMRTGGIRNFHVHVVNQLLAAGQVSSRQAVELYASVLNDPSAYAWTLDPIESLSLLLSPHTLAHENWFEAAVSRDDEKLALEVSDRTRRRRFLASLPMGGRLLALRWVLEAQLETLPREAQLERQAVLTRYPAYAERSRRAQEQLAALRQQAVAPGGDDLTARLRSGLAEVAQLAGEQERILHEMALRREPCTMVFPPARSAEQIMQEVPAGQAVLAFFVSRGVLHGFAVEQENITHWRVGAAAELREPVAQLLRELGHVDANRELTADVLRDTAWKSTSAALFARLIGGNQSHFPASARELVIVPDDVLWYLPFETLHVASGPGLEPLIARFRVRFAPTAALSVPSQNAVRRQVLSTALVAERLFPRDDPEVAQTAFEDLRRALPNATRWTIPLPAPSPTLAALADRLIVLDDLEPPERAAPFDWTPVNLDKLRGDGTVQRWLKLPFDAPDELLLPGFHTVAETGLKRLDTAAPGNDVFLSVTGLLGSGVRTLLISRWRPAGQTSFQLMREFVQELPFTTPADAWQRSVFLTAATPVDPQAEPRVSRTDMPNPPTAEHPFFWAAYMIVDSGTPHIEDDGPGGGVLDVQPAAARVDR